MAYRASHIGLTVSDLAAAETFYRRCFGMGVLVREIHDGSSWRSLDPAIGWDEAAALGLDIRMVVLTRDDLALALDVGSELGRPTHVGLFLSPGEYARVLAEVGRMGLDLRETSPTRFLFADPFAVLWELQSEPRLLTARDMGMGWLDAAGGTHVGDGEV
ncbi:VOC family protein [Streptomyces sp. NPDC054904]|uniref:VOC family protein n=1 Tax=unclassified Streptomyces TaxID=2593676 RepID=UPI002481ABFC|nr:MULTISPECIES: VOC family protein [unclassified Streptomyces]MDA5279818.1 hypothetical protein [Streptomyces sp. Isolate_45]MDX2391409.1 VOC family protein [Streptomyces sp. DK15]